MWTILLLACGSETSVNYDKYNGGSLDGSIEGWVCDPEAGVWMENATVYTNIINAVGDFLDTRETVTDKDGHYLLEELLTDTTYTIYVQKGATTVDLFDVELGNDSQVLEKPQCSATATESTIAVVTGVYDDLPTVLTDLSLSVYEVNGKSGEDAAAFLTDSVNLEPFSMVMLAGGTVEEDVYYDSDGNDGAGTSAAVQAAIKAYVEGGGTLWATDWTYDIVEQIWPGKVDFLGEDKTPNAAQVGTPGALDAHIEDGDWKNAIGKASIEVQYKNDTWPVVESVDESVTVIETAIAPYRIGMDTFEQKDSPLALYFDVGKGRVIYTTWMVDENAQDSKKGIKLLLGI